MRIIIAHSHLDSFGGGERATLELLRHLSARHAVELWAGGYTPQATFAGLGDYPRRDISPLGWLRDTPRADAVVAQTFGAYLLALRHPRTVSYLHSLRSVYLHGGWRPDLVARRALDHRALDSAAALLANSTYTAEQAQRRYERPVAVVPPGADETLFALPERVGRYALYVGRLVPEKGLERLLAWSASVPIDLVIVGAGTAGYVAHLRALAGPRTHFTGPLTGAALAGAYDGARYLTFVPHAEEFGLAALDAMAAARPVLAAPEGGLAELVRDGETGLFARDARAFAVASARLLANEALCLRLGRTGRARAREYTWARFAQGVEAACLAAAGGRA
ncbi:MAG: glycosyltransferase family 4 protein [Ktedonobacterales bacterium]|nr:glycosyltransferase family 4 protein [Ktedonobacterales bacterium]